MEVADHVAVMNQGGLEQVGSPTDLYDHPASEFVLRFLGDAFKLGDGFVRPHEISLARVPSDGAIEVEIERLVVVGADTRIELVDGSGERMNARLRRDDVEHLELTPGEIVWATPEQARHVAGASR
jgi:sulfate transport system ATP-binding protein